MYKTTKNKEFQKDYKEIKNILEDDGLIFRGGQKNDF